MPDIFKGLREIHPGASAGFRGVLPGAVEVFFSTIEATFLCFLYELALDDAFSWDGRDWAHPHCVHGNTGGVGAGMFRVSEPDVGY
jgi:hypothetical protein